MTGFAGRRFGCAGKRDQGNDVEQWGVFERRRAFCRQFLCGCAVWRAIYSGPSESKPMASMTATESYKVRFSRTPWGAGALKRRSNEGACRAPGSSIALRRRQAIADRWGRPPIPFSIRRRDAVFSFRNHCYSYGFIGAPIRRRDTQEPERGRIQKVRMCLLPKPLGKLQPVAMPFERVGESSAAGCGKSRGQRGETRSNRSGAAQSGIFQHVEERIQDLMAARIEAE